ncbi:SNARE-interacting protein KEULE-like isoform X13 [Mangifera indica]|uniref:SNARE-interacting protein KEULE-like isoform X13 n=1 Tax=Mangifera indica TaxID=29780 RepID=UPI001CF93F03|nr:SNARE-interacting protein KEULE-like isoform X13 [Mangifera indica]
MSNSDSDSSSHNDPDYKKFRQITRDSNLHWSLGLLHEMLGSAKTGSSISNWKVLIMDKLTVKIMSYSCKMVDIIQEGVSLVEDINKRRQPLPSMDAVYFIQPTKENVLLFLSDMSGKSPLYRRAFVFFSSPISRELVTHIKKDTRVITRLGALREMNLEYLAIDSQGFVTDNERALEELFGDGENSRKGDACLDVMATRIATVFASLREFPFVRYRAAKMLDAMTVTTFYDLVPTKLAAAVWNCLMKYRQTIENFPQTETCDLLILDRSVDQIAPIIHEWTYDAICHDLLNMEGNKYVQEVPSKTGGPPEKKEVLLEEHDPIWLELRDVHIADASERLHEKMTNFVSKNKVAQIQQGSRFGSELSTRDLQKMVDALPQYSEQIEKLSLHVEIAGKVNKIIREFGLIELGQLEQNLVFGAVGMKDVIKFLATKEDITSANKLRLLMILASMYPEKFEGDKGMNLMKELVEKLSKRELSKDDYPCVNDPSPTFHSTTLPTVCEAPAAHSMRSRPKSTWARQRYSDDGYSSDSVLRYASGELKKMGQRIFVFIVGGATRSELRVCHKLTTKLNREVILGSSSIDDPPQFIKVFTFPSSSSYPAQINLAVFCFAETKVADCT